VSLPPTKQILTEAEAGASGLVRLWLRVMRVLDIQDKHAKKLDAQAAQIEVLTDKVRVLEAREEMLRATVEAAAARATADLASRVGSLKAATAGIETEQRKRHTSLGHRSWHNYYYAASGQLRTCCTSAFPTATACPP
jgi:hypothetical protein